MEKCDLGVSRVATVLVVERFEDYLHGMWVRRAHLMTKSNHLHPIVSDMRTRILLVLGGATPRWLTVNKVGWAAIIERLPFSPIKYCDW
eukprot:877780-Amphidinium_carterae.2